MTMLRKADRSFRLVRTVNAVVETQKAILVKFTNIDTKEIKEVWLPKEACQAEKQPRMRKRFDISIPAWLLAKNGMDDVTYHGGSSWFDWEG